MVGASVGRTLLSAAFDFDFAALSLGPTFKSKSESKAADKSVRPTQGRIASMRPVFEWQIGSRAVQLGKRTLIMGVVNVTPDSFSDGGVNFDRDRAVEYALKLLQDGADIVDVGGESTRPGAKVVSHGRRSDGEGRTRAGDPGNFGDQAKEVPRRLSRWIPTRPASRVPP